MRSKTLLSILLLAGANAATAQTNLSVYGILDSGLLYQSKSINNAGSGVTFLDGGLSPSIYGFRGSEDLGGGLKASFNLEGGYSTASGAFGNSTGGIFGRAATLELAGGFGALKAGLQFSPFFLALIGSEPRGMAQFSSQLMPYLNQFGLTGLFDKNALVYTTPALNGLSASLEYALGEVAGNTSRGRTISAAVNYKNAGLMLNTAYLRANNAVTNQVNAKGWTVGGGYTVKDLAIKASYTRYEKPVVSTVAVNVIGLGASYPVSSTVSINGGVYSVKESGSSNNDSLLFGFGADYGLSKRTMLYTQFGVVDNSGNMQIGLAANAPASYTVPTGATTAALNVGVRHLF